MSGNINQNTTNMIEDLSSNNKTFNYIFSRKFILNQGL